MKTIGLSGGMSWESSAGYYRLVNEGMKQRLGGLHSAKSAMYSVDFHEIGNQTGPENGKWTSVYYLRRPVKWPHHRVVG